MFIPILITVLEDKIEKIQKRCLRLVPLDDDYESNYGNLIKKNGTTTMEIRDYKLWQLKYLKQ